MTSQQSLNTRSISLTVKALYTLLMGKNTPVFIISLNYRTIYNSIWDDGNNTHIKEVTEDQAFFDIKGKEIKAADPNWEAYTAPRKKNF